MSAALTLPVAAQRRHPLSASQVKTYIECAYRWYCEHALKLPAPPSGALALGRAVHRAIAAVLRGKGANRVLPPIEEAIEIYAKVALEEISQAELSKDEDPAQLADLGGEMLKAWHKGPAQRIDPAAVETEIRGHVGGVDVVAVADCITTDRCVIDFKTASRKPGAISQSHGLQLTTYGLLSGCNRARLITITKAKQPATVEHTHVVSLEWAKHAAVFYPLIAEEMTSGLYPPRRQSTLCSRKHCPYWRKCLAEFGGEVF